MTKNTSQLQDIQLIVGGNFTPDSLGPEEYNDVVNRVQANPQEYFDHFERLFLAQNFDAMTQSRLHLPAFIRLLIEVEPERAKAVAGQLLQQYNAVLVLYDSAVDKQALSNVISEDIWHLSQRLHRRRLELQILAQKE
jgi:hypothetical protein